MFTYKMVPIVYTGLRWKSHHHVMYFTQRNEWVAQLFPTLCNPMDYTIHGILQARILEWVASPFSRGTSQPRDWTQVFCVAGGFFTSWATREALYPKILNIKCSNIEKDKERIFGLEKIKINKKWWCGLEWGLVSLLANRGHEKLDKSNDQGKKRGFRNIQRWGKVNQFC